MTKDKTHCITYTLRLPRDVVVRLRALPPRTRAQFVRDALAAGLAAGLQHAELPATKLVDTEQFSFLLGAELSDSLQGLRALRKLSHYSAGALRRAFANNDA